MNGKRRTLIPPDELFTNDNRKGPRRKKPIPPSNEIKKLDNKAEPPKETPVSRPRTTPIRKNSKSIDIPKENHQIKKEHQKNAIPKKIEGPNINSLMDSPIPEEDTKPTSKEDCFIQEADPTLDRLEEAKSNLLVLFLVAIIVLLIWGIVGLLMSFDIIPFSDFGYIWFNHNIYPLF